MSTTLPSVTDTLLANYDRVASADRGLFASDARITTRDLEAVLADPDPGIPQDVRDAAQFLLDSEVSQRYLDVAGGSGGIDGSISRDDLQAAAGEIGTGRYYQQLLDTAAEGRSAWWNPFASAADGAVGAADIEVALADPGVPEGVKDTLRMIQLGGDPAAATGILRGLTADAAAAAGALYDAPEFSALSPQERQLVAGAWSDSGGSVAVTRDLLTLIRDPSFEAMSPAQRSAALTEAALLQSPEYRALPASDQRLVREALDRRAPGDTALPASIGALIESEAFQVDAGFTAAERTAVLNQVRNYPDARAVENLERLVGKDWFGDFGLGDTQRAAKTVAFLSQNDAGDQAIIANTLDLFLADDAPYRFDFSETSAYGSVPRDPDDLFRINPAYIAADNAPVDTSARSAETGELRVIGHTFVHEVNHMRNWDRSMSLNSAYGFHEEYRAFYVGVSAQSGRTPAVADVIDRVAGFVNHDGSYDHLATLLDGGGSDAQEIVDYLNTILGRSDLTVDNARDEVNALVDARKQAEAAGDPLPSALTRPAGVTIGPDGTNNLTND